MEGFFLVDFEFSLGRLDSELVWEFNVSELSTVFRDGSLYF